MKSSDILAWNLLRHRYDNNLSQEELAWRIGMDVKRYAEIEHAQAHTTLLTLDKLSDATGIPVPELLTPQP